MLTIMVTRFSGHARPVLRTTIDATGIALNGTSAEPAQFLFLRTSMSAPSEPIALRAGGKSAVRFLGCDIRAVGFL